MDVTETMVPLVQAFGALLVALGLAYRLAGLRIFNLLVPKDSGADVIARDLSYGSHARQRLDLYRPLQSGGRLPLVIFVHGGGWDSGDKRSYGFAARAFAARGYLTATINYRLAPQHLFPAFVEDVAHAVAHLQGVARQFGGDAERIYLVGHSAGGYCVLQAVLDEQFLRAGRVAPETIRGVAALAAPADFLPLDSPKSIAAFSHWPDPAQTQPITYARKDAPPVLLLHGSQDRTVFTHNSINLAAKLQAAGAIAQYTEYPGVGHVKIMMALAKPLRGQVPVLDDILRFFAAHK